MTLIFHWHKVNATTWAASPNLGAYVITKETTPKGAIFRLGVIGNNGVHFSRWRSYFDTLKEAKEQAVLDAGGEQ